MKSFNQKEDAIEEIFKTLGKDIRLAAPLGAGKANHLLNEIYSRAKKDPSIKLTIYTALTLQKPEGKSLLEKRFLNPFADKVFGNYPNLLFEEDRLKNTLPDNIHVIEFYLRAGQYKNHEYGQQNYLSSNYTHVTRDLASRDVNVICQQVCKGEIDGQEVYSLSTNPDTTADLVDLLKAKGNPFVTIAQVNQDLPFMYGESIVGKDYFDLVVDNEEEYYPVFAPPKMSISDADYMIGLHSSTLVKDDGEIQIGIGSLGDALVYGLTLRQKDNSKYLEVLKNLEINETSFPIIRKDGGTTTFKKGLFAATEMLVDSFSFLYTEGILKKKVYDSVIIQRLLNNNLISEKIDNQTLNKLFEAKAIQKEITFDEFNFLTDFGILKKGLNWDEIPKNIQELSQEEFLGESLRNGAVAHGGFFLGPRAFYNFLKELPIEERKLFRMKRISQINHLYQHEEIDRLQRINGRFINTCMKVTLNGSACSDALEDGNQISGVGGQYNFVAMAHELPDARSVLQLRSTRFDNKGRLESNIVFNYGNCTIPRHLRDVIITEYGIADLRSKTDSEVAQELIQIADSRFQESLIEQAIKAKKLPEGFKLAPRFTQNFPARYQKVLKELKKEKLFIPFPFGTDLSDDEIKIGKSLKALKALMKNKPSFIKFFLSALLAGSDNKEIEHLLVRMNLNSPNNLKEKIFSKLLSHAIKKFS
ncbi:MAG: acetyl-CoA hydrolase [Oligoflexia bacterium]|nr:acetyl-CoA hydrolase [Oligoflexia bacterium]